MVTEKTYKMRASLFRSKRKIRVCTPKIATATVREVRKLVIPMPAFSCADPPSVALVLCEGESEVVVDMSTTGTARRVDCMLEKGRSRPQTGGW